MPPKTKRSPLILTGKQKMELQKISGSRSAPLWKVEWSRIILDYCDGIALSTIAIRVGVSRPTVYKCIDQALSMGWSSGLNDHNDRDEDFVISFKRRTVSNRGD